MRATRNVSVLLLVILAISLQSASACELLKKFLMGNKASAASKSGSVAMQSIFDFKVDAISGVVDLATYKYVSGFYHILSELPHHPQNHHLTPD